MEKLRDFEYIYIVCTTCNDRVKIGKNKGAYWKTNYNPDWIYTFLLQHSNCDSEGIKLIKEKR